MSESRGELEDSASNLSCGAQVHSSKRWRNPYIDRLPTLSDFILGASSVEPNQDDLNLLQKKLGEFANSFLEFGSGSGRHLIALAQQHPDALFIGFELRFKRVYKTAEKAARLGLKNLLVIKSPAQRAAHFFGPDSISGVYVNFPDPWDKRRWEKHRLLSPQMFNDLAKLLRAGGFVAYKTDHPERFIETSEIIKSLPNFVLTKFTQNLNSSEYAPSNIMTEFESLFVAQGLSINFLEAQKRL